MVKCADCGFLSAHNFEDGSLMEVLAESRRTGRPPIRSGNRSYVYHNIPVCFVDAHDLQSEAGAEAPDNFKRVVNAERECKSCEPWKRGRSPREHLQMVENRTLVEWQEKRLREDREAQDRRDEAARQAAQKSKEDDRAWQEARRQDDRVWQRKQERWRWVISLGGIVLGAILGYFLKR